MIFCLINVRVISIVLLKHLIITTKAYFKDHNQQTRVPDMGDSFNWTVFLLGYKSFLQFANLHERLIPHRVLDRAYCKSFMKNRTDQYA